MDIKTTLFTATYLLLWLNKTRHEIEKNPMNKKLTVKILKVFVTAFLIMYIFSKVDIMNLLITIKSAHIYLLIIAFLSNGIGILVRVYKWKIILLVQEINVPFKTLLTFSFTSAFFGIFLPTAYGGDIVRAYDVSKFSNKKFESVASILVDRMSGAVALFFIATVSLLVGHDLIKDIRIVLLTIGVLLLLLSLISIIFNEKGIKIISKIFTFFFNKDIVSNAYNKFHIYRYHKRALIEIFALSLFAQIIAIVYYPLIAYSFGLNIPLVYFLIVIPIILVILMVPISIGGIGVREGAFLFFFTNIGVLPHEAVSIAVVAFGLYLLWSLIGGVVYIMRDPKKANPNRPLDSDPSNN